MLMPQTKALFTRNVCVCGCVNIYVNFNIELLVTQMHMQRMGHRPIVCINQFIVEIDANVDADAHADVTCKHGLNGLHGNK